MAVCVSDVLARYILPPVLSEVECSGSWPAHAQCEWVRPCTLCRSKRVGGRIAVLAVHVTAYLPLPGECGSLGAGRWRTCGTCAGSRAEVDCKRL